MKAFGDHVGLLLTPNGIVANGGGLSNRLADVIFIEHAGVAGDMMSPDTRQKICL